MESYPECYSTKYADLCHLLRIKLVIRLYSAIMGIEWKLFFNRPQGFYFWLVSIIGLFVMGGLMEMGMFLKEKQNGTE